ncbi:MAG: hypothetical protein COB22_05930 [Cycloclasticus sp.]|nr:MAG: hypothetical protein COB22_05930 [Cycloclasticus sp.]
MAERISSAKRIKLRNRAEIEVMRYKNDHSLWHKHIHNVELDPMQILKCIEMDQNPNTIDFSCRRTGKTAIKELYQNKQNATQPDQELGIVAPREAQALVNLGYHLDAIRRSPILDAWIAVKSGRKQLADTYYEFANRSKTRAYGIMSQMDGGDLTAASLEEVDDMPRDRLYSNFLMMMGSNRRLGADLDSKNNPEIRVTGVFKGADTLSDMISSEGYHVLPTIDCYLGMEMGIIDENFMMQMRKQLAPDEYIRQMLCKNISSRNLIWEKYIRRSMQVGLEASLQIASPLPGEHYKKRGLISFGYDAGGHGENPTSSKHALVVTEQIGNFTTFPYVRTWTPGADDNMVKKDLLGLWEYFNPDYAMGDAYGVGMLTSLNDDLYDKGLTHIDRRAIGDGDSTASTWPEWPFSPIRFEGMTKHSMAQSIKSLFHNRQAAIPYFDDQNMTDPEIIDFRTFIGQLANIVPVATKTTYASYKQANTKIGDDLFDAAMAAVWALATRGACAVQTTVLTNTKTRQQLMGAA